MRISKIFFLFCLSLFFVSFGRASALEVPEFTNSLPFGYFGQTYDRYFVFKDSGQTGYRSKGSLVLVLVRSGSPSPYLCKKTIGATTYLGFFSSQCSGDPTNYAYWNGTGGSVYTPFFWNGSSWVLDTSAYQKYSMIDIDSADYSVDDCSNGVVYTSYDPLLYNSTTSQNYGVSYCSLGNLTTAQIVFSNFGGSLPPNSSVASSLSLGDSFVDLFVPEEGFFSAQYDSISLALHSKFAGFYDLVDEVNSSNEDNSSASGDFPSLSVNLYGSEIVFLDSSLFAPVAPEIRFWISFFLYFSLILFLIYRLPDLFK